VVVASIVCVVHAWSDWNHVGKLCCSVHRVPNVFDMVSGTPAYLSAFAGLCTMLAYAIVSCKAQEKAMLRPMASCKGLSKVIRPPCLCSIVFWQSLALFGLPT
jgi:hypothetical protein